MDIRPLSDTYAVTPQIEPEDLPAIKAQGFTTVICNRPNEEVPVELSTEALRAAVEAAGLTFVENQFQPGQLTNELINTQRAAIDSSEGPVLAYCASGNRSSILWALAMAGRMPTDDLINAGARYGYSAGQFRAAIERLAEGH